MDRDNDGRLNPPPAAAGPARAFNLDQARIEQAARARRILDAVAADGDLVETLCGGIIDLQAENKKLVDQVAALQAKLDAANEKAKAERDQA